MQIQYTQKKGFSLIEIIVAVGIVALIAVAATVSYTSQRVRSRETRRIQDVSTISDALRNYEVTNNSVPATSTAVAVDSGILSPLVTAGVLNDIPKDPSPAGGIVGSDSIICFNYQYDDDWNASSLTFGSNSVGTRNYYVAFGSEVKPVGTSGQHPYNNSVYLHPNSSGYCNGTRWLGMVFGDRK